MKRTILAAAVAAAVGLGIAPAASADDTPPSGQPGHTSTACLYAAYWTAELCPGVPAPAYTAEQEAAMSDAGVRYHRHWKPRPCQRWGAACSPRSPKKPVVKKASKKVVKKAVKRTVRRAR